MITTDPIADMLTRMRNALTVKHKTVNVPTSKMKVAIAELLKNEGYINDYKVSEGSKGVITIDLKYGQNNQKVINGLKRIYHVIIKSGASRPPRTAPPGSPEAPH